MMSLGARTREAPKGRTISVESQNWQNEEVQEERAYTKKLEEKLHAQAGQLQALVRFAVVLSP
eukprot:51086-Pyramimonas_sp.AAC.1